MEIFELRSWSLESVCHLNFSYWVVAEKNSIWLLLHSHHDDEEVNAKSGFLRHKVNNINAILCVPYQSALRWFIEIKHAPATWVFPPPGDFFPSSTSTFHVLFFFAHSSKFQLSWWIYQTNHPLCIISFFLQCYFRRKSKFFWACCRRKNFHLDSLDVSEINLHCINPQQSYRWWSLLLYKFVDKLKLYLLDVNVTRFFSALSGHFFHSLCDVKTFSKRVEERKRTAELFV